MTSPARILAGRLVHALRLFGRGMAPPAAAFLVCLPTPLPSAAAEMSVDAAIVFAVDTSSSIGPELADLQRRGHAEALRSPEVEAAIAGGATGCAAVAYVEWSSATWLRTVLPWTRLCGRDDALAAAAVILEQGDDGTVSRGRGRTSISYGIEASSLMLDRLPGRAGRKIVDISANGTNNDGRPVAGARERVIAKGHVINAIVLERTEPGVSDDLPGYFRDSVIGGAGAFVVTPTGPADYARALRRKLVMEIGDSGIAGEERAFRIAGFDILPGNTR